MNRTALTVAALGIALAISGPALAGTKAGDLGASVAKAGAAGKKGLPPGFYTSQAHANGHSAGAPGHDYDHHTKSRGC